MKRTLSLILAVILSVFCLASCGGEEAKSAYDLYNNAMKAYENGIDLKLTMTMNVAGQEVETVMNMKGGKDAYEIQMDVEGMAVNAVYVDGVMYMDMDLGAMGSQKFKQELSLEEFMTEAGANGTDMPELTKDILKDIPVETKDGKKTFTVKLDSEKYAELLTSFTGPLDTGAKMDDITLTCSFKDSGVMESLVMSANATVGKETTAIEVKMEFNSIGKAPSISAPADADSYKDMGNLLG